MSDARIVVTGRIETQDRDQYMNEALRLIRESVAAPSDFARMGSLAMSAFRIAQELAVAAAIEVGAEPLPWEALPAAFRLRMRQEAERAIRAIDLNVRVEAADEAVVDTEEWHAGPYDGHPPTIADIARKAISRYETLLSGQKPIDTPAGKCRACSGNLWRDADGVISCENCSRVFQERP